MFSFDFTHDDNDDLNEIWKRTSENQVQIYYGYATAAALGNKSRSCSVIGQLSCF